MINWLFNNKSVTHPPEGVAGFVYCITNTVDGREYIGRKYFFSTRRVKQKGKTRRKVVRAESNWREYTSSSTELNADIAKLGIDKFKFEILRYGSTRGEVNYLEENIQHKLDVLTATNSKGIKKFYNSSIGSRKFISVKHSEPSKSIICERLLGE